MARPVHPDKHIENAVSFAESKGWRFVAAGKSSHAWGRLFCPSGQPGGCKLSVASTPRNGMNHARSIIRRVNACAHKSSVP